MAQLHCWLYSSFKFPHHAATALWSYRMLIASFRSTWSTGYVKSLLDGRACALTCFVECTGNLVTDITFLYEFASRTARTWWCPRSFMNTKSSTGETRFGSHHSKAAYMASLGSSLRAIKMKSPFPEVLKARHPSWRWYGPCNPASKAIQKEQPLWKDNVGPFCMLFLFYMLQAFRKSYQGIAGGVWHGSHSLHKSPISYLTSQTSVHSGQCHCIELAQILFKSSSVTTTDRTASRFTYESWEQV